MLSVRTFCTTFLRRRSTCSVSVANDSAVLPQSTKAVDPNKPEDLQPESINPRSRQYAVLLCYHGEKYFGLQYNETLPTIEGHLFPALIRVGLLSEATYHDTRFNLRYTRASRTDSGVSALRQTISFNSPREINVDELNAHLPHDIRVLGSIRVTKSFDAQKWCDFRSYCYIMPSFALCNWWAESKNRVNYRADAYTLSKANEIFKVYEGSHKFHNYTEKRDIWDNRSHRVIQSASVSDVFLYGNMEMVAFHLKGKSFMLHQIRRMIGMTIAIMRGKAPYSFLHNSFENPILPAPTAPGLGLILEKQYFDNYNRHHKDMEPLIWDEYDNEVEKFKHEVIVPHIVAVEQRENVMENFLLDIRKHSFSVCPASSKLTTIGTWKGLELDEEDMKIIAKYQ